MIYDVDGMLPARAFQRGFNGRIMPQAGGGQSQPAQQQVNNTSIPEYARPYVEKSLAKMDALTSAPYTPYSGQRTAAFTPMQAQAMGDVANMQTSQQLNDASNLAYRAGQGGMGAYGNSQGLQQTSLGYGQAGAGYGGAASMFGSAGAQQAQQASEQAQNAAQMYGAQGSQYGAQGANTAQQAQRAAEGQADIYGQMGAGFGAQAAGLAPQAQQYGSNAANLGMAGMGYGAQGADIGGIGVQQAQQGFGAGQQYANQATSPGAQQAYMSPYMQNVVDVQQKDAMRQAEIARQGTQAQAVKSGAFGGSRSAIVEAENQRGLQDRLANIQATGSQAAFDKAQQAQQFAANVGIQGLQAGYQGLNTGLSGTAQGMQGAQTGIQGQQAGLAGLSQAGQSLGLGMQGAGLGLQGTGQRLAAGQLGLQGTAQGMQGAQTGLQSVGQQIAGGQLGLQGANTGISGQQAGMQGAQAGMQGVQGAVGAGQYGLSGLGTTNQSANTLGNLGQAEFGQNQSITDAQMRAGTMQQQQEQQGLDLQYQQFLDELNKPYKDLEVANAMYRGLPMSQTASSIYQNPSPISQGIGTATAGYGLYQMNKKANGGAVKAMANGGLATLGLYNAMKKGSR